MSEDFKGFLSPAEEKFLANVIDDLLVFKNKWLETIDGPAALIMIRGIDNRFCENINPEWKEPLKPIVRAAMAGQADEVRKLFTDFMNGKVNIPYAGDVAKLFMVDGAVRFFYGAILWWVDFKASKENEG